MSLLIFLKDIVMLDKLPAGARIRVVVGVMSITLGLMDLINPTVSVKWRWLRELAVSLVGPYGYAILLICIGSAFLVWSSFEIKNSKD